jgi:MFS family permease
LVGGVVADRIGRRLVMLSADAIRFVAQAALAAWVLAGRPPVWGLARVLGQDMALGDLIT